MRVRIEYLLEDSSGAGEFDVPGDEDGTRAQMFRSFVDDVIKNGVYLDDLDWIPASAVKRIYADETETFVERIKP